MSRNNQKGFLLAESLIVATFVLSLLIFLFVQFKNLSTSYDAGFKYNSVEGLYALDNVKTYLKENASDNKKVSDSLKAQTKPYLYIYKSGDATCNDNIGLRGTGYCKTLMEEQNIKSIIFTRANVTEGDNSTSLKKWLKNTNLNEEESNIFSENMKDFILRVNVKEINHTYRLIAEFNDGSFATFNVGDENWSSSKYNDPDYVDPSYNVGAAAASCFTTSSVDGGVSITGYTCTSNKTPKIPSEINSKRVVAIGTNAFKDKAITAVTIPPGVRTIENYAFYNNSLTSINIPVSVLKIGQHAFGSNRLTGNLIIPDSVSIIGDGAFANNQLTSVKIGITVNSIGGSAFLNNQLTSVIFNDYLYSIGNSAFASNKLTKIDLPEGVTSIGDGAFYNNQIREVVIPGSVTTIGNTAFKETTVWEKDGIDIEGDNPYRFNGRWTEIGWPITSIPWVQTYNTTGLQTFEVPLDGYYRIDLWGAQGGGSFDAGANKARTNGGKGAYTSGIVKLEAGKKLFIHVGAKGNDGNSGSNALKGNNGGGSASHGNESSTTEAIFKAAAGGGGDATDVRYGADNLASRIMVAAGGGGSVHTTDGGAGGDLWAPNSPLNKDSITGGAKQSGGASFGNGGNGSGTGAGYGVPGGGGGYYGGTTSSAKSFGGSSFISGYAGSNAINSGGSHVNNIKHYSNLYFTQTKMANGLASMPATDLTGTETGHAGNGYARITYLGNDKPTTSKLLTKVRYVKDCIQGNTSNDGNHWLEIQAIADGTNVAKGKTVTGLNGNTTASAPSNAGYAFSHATDGVFDKFDGYSGWAYMDPNKTVSQCLVIDLGKEYDLEEIAVWRYFNSTLYAKDDRIYKNHKVSVASTDKTYRDIYYKSGTSGPNESPNGIHIK